MQYPVPQFTEVEDKLIGPLSLKQFFILLFAGMMIIGGYSATKSVIALVILCLIFGLPAVALAFVKINGRALYLQLPALIKFFIAPKRLVFHKEAASFSSAVKMIELTPEKPQDTPPAFQDSTQERLREVQEILRKQQQEEEQLAGRIR